MADSSTFAVLNLGSQRVGGAVFSRNRSGELLLKQLEFVEMHGDPGVEATRLPQMRVAVMELADKLKLKGRSVWYSIAGHVVFTRFVKLPPFQDDKADQIVEFEARQNVPFPINEVIWDYEFIGAKSGPEREVALVAIKADALNDINDQIESNGVSVAGVDLAPLALYNAFRYTYPDVEGPALIIDLGAKSTNLVFIEGDRLFTRNILSGGASVTGAVAKEIGVSFGEAEEQKRSQGFIAPGGAHEPHEDETINAISKIMRNSMTRLHGEVVRTINYYRGQQGGSAPKQIFLAGGGANTQLASEFFGEKFNLPVEVLNPLRGIQVDPRCESSAQANGPAAGELVGLALRHAGSAPVEVELVPDSVTLARDSAKRTPALILAMLGLFALLGVGVFYFKQAAAVVNSKRDALTAVHTQLSAESRSLKDVKTELDAARGESAQLEDAVKTRAFWKNLCAVLNNKFGTDYVWITQIELLKNGASVTPSPAGNAAAAAAPAPASGTPGAVAASEPQFEIRFQGLYRKNDNGPKVVYDYFDALLADKTAQELFVATDKKAEVDAGLDDRYAYKFNHRLALQPGVMKFDK